MVELLLPAQEALFGSELATPVFLDDAAVIIGVITGAMAGCNRQMDVVGTIIAGILTGYGGGIVRDLLLRDHGIYFMEHPNLLVCSIFIAAFVFYFRGLFEHREGLLEYLDIFSVGMFTLAGVDKTWACGFGVVYALFLGLSTGVFGGALRDIMTNEVPAIFKPSYFYAVASLAGAGSYVILMLFGCPRTMAGIVCVAATVFVRNWSTTKHLDTYAPDRADLSPYVKSLALRFARKIR